MADIKYSVIIDASTCAAEIKKLEGEIDKLAGTTKKGADEAATGSGKHKSFIDQIAIGNIIANAGSKVLHTFWNELKSVVTAAADSEAANVRLDMALFSTGRQAAQLNEHYKKQAEALMKLTTYDDEAIKGAQAMLLQLARLDSEGIDRATKSTIGLATVFKMDLVNAAELVGKWMSGNTDRLSKYGIHVNDTMSVEQKRNEILRQLAVYYQQAEAATGTYAGKLLQLKNNYGELKEEIGRYFTENVKLVDVLNEVTRGLYDFFEAGKSYKRELAEQEKANVEWGNRIYEAAIKAGKSRYEIEQMIKMFPGLTKEQKYNADNMAWAIKMGEFGTKMKGEYLKVEKAYNEALAEQNRLRRAGERGTSIGESSVIILKETPMLVGRVRDAYKWLSTELGMTESKYRHMGMVAYKAVEQMSEGPQYIKRAWIDNMDAIKQHADIVLGGMSDISNLYFTNRSIAIENDYIRQREFIEKSKMTEEEKNKAFEKLDADYAAKKKAAQKTEFIISKAFHAAEAIMAAWQASVGALLVPPVPNFVLAAITKAFGVAQAALILAQPMPLQAGAYTTGEGLAYLHPHEIVAPETKMKETFREVIHERGSSKTIHLHQNIYVGGQKIKEVVTEIVERTSREGTLKIAAKAIR